MAFVPVIDFGCWTTQALLAIEVVRLMGMLLNVTKLDRHKRI